MKLVSASQMQVIDKRAQTDYLIPLAAIFEQAGYKVALEVKKILQDKKGSKISIVAGSGNNAIDSLVAARYLHDWDLAVKVFVLSSITEVKADMQPYTATLQELGVETVFFDDEHVWDRFSISLRMSDIIVDGILGTGFKDTLSERYEKAIHIINLLPVKTVSVDIPSGCHADTGDVPTSAVKADVTLCLCLPKYCLFLAPANAYVGELRVLEINIPKKLLSMHANAELITPELVRSLLPARSPHMHKYQAGKASILAGNSGMIGACYLAATACMRIGAGIVDVFTMQAVYNALAVKLTESLLYPVSEAEPEVALTKFIASANTAKSVLVGPGLGNNACTKAFVAHILSKLNVPLVLDADALSALSNYQDMARQYSSELVITPHTGEFSRLINVKASVIETNKIEYATNFATANKTIVVLKGSVTIIALPDGEIFINNAPLPGMASAGMGDVLAGMITGLIAQGLSAKAACIVGVYLHTQTARFLAERGLAIGLLASDLAQSIPLALADFTKSSH